MLDKQNNQFQWPIVGHANIVSYLQNNILANKVAHAYLFVGPANIGKTAVAEFFVNSLVCERLDSDTEEKQIPCNECSRCQQVKNKIHPDIFWLSREINEKTEKLKKNISIEQIRELQNKLSLCSFLDSYKIAVIREASTLSKEAANSLLKTLEEPAPKTVMILLTASLADLPRTIVSRCQVIKFLPVAGKEIIDYLIFLKTEKKKAKTLAELSFGRPGVAINYLHSSDDYLDFQEKVKQFISLLKSEDINERFKLINNLIKFNDVDFLKDILIIWKKILRDLLLIKYSGQNFISNFRFSSDLAQLVDVYAAKSLIADLKEINSAKRYLDSNVNPKLVLENLVLNF